MSDTYEPDGWERDWLEEQRDLDIQGEFEDFWLDVCAYANEIGYPVSYVEDEFIIDGELIEVKVYDDIDPEEPIRYVPRPGPM